MKQVVVAAVVLVAFFVGGPWFAGKVGPGLADLITQWATPDQPCPTATATPARRKHQARPHRAHDHRAHPSRREPARRHHAAAPHPRKPRPSPSASATCEPSSSASAR
ncbi:hypothetical protein [Nocardioides marmoribigeumensis]|jgi:hypothetical protein|uniref:Uncharacterized protein n=1 Tax=Nocardioides marmoribigeumensis TaxID=433649 RepID=A0ABU2BYC8_9ACTN|nr:hypothetical protein [Nocardioides marmoribigeumensis]MDR7363410.1 hypothetical protein [Nocardioides marmoribigeumensis]